MKKGFNWVWGAIICTALLLCLLPQLATPVEATTYNGTCGDNLTWDLDIETGELTISGVGEMHECGGYEDFPWHSYRDLIKAVTIDDGVTKISECAFMHCLNLSSVKIPDSVTSMGDGAFHRCDNLTDVYITDIASWCKVEFEAYDSNPLRFGANLYLNGEPVEHLVIPDGITSIGNYSFIGCTTLISVTIPDSVSTIGFNAFAYCSNLNSVMIPDSVTSIGNYAFLHCSSLKSVMIPDSVTNISFGAFFGCTSLSSVTIPDSVTVISFQAFAYCSGLTSVVIPDSVTVFADFAFAKCTSLSTVTIPDGVTIIGASAFDGCASLTSITIPDGVTKIGHRAFFACTNLTSVTVPDGVTSIGASAFALCRGLRNAYIGSEMDEFSYAVFAECENLTNVRLGPNVTTIGRSAFEKCKKLTSVSFYSSVTTIMQGAFYECPQLTHVLFDGTADQWNRIAMDPDNLTIMDATIHYNASSDTVCWKNIGGSTCLYCTICETALTEPCEHENTELRGAVAATCTEPGSTGDTYCTVCGEKLAEGETIAALGHGATELRDAVEATCTEAGYTGDSYCTVCGEKLAEGEEIPALGHNFEDGFCSVCGVKDPDYLPSNPFADVKENAYFYSPVLWAVEQGITNGTTATTFSPEDPCTRGQIVTFLWRAFGSPEPEKDENPFTDVPENMYYYKAILWAVEQGITTGTSSTTFSPEDTCTRGQVATFLWRACGKPAPESSDNPFSDVPEAMYYYEPILWAVEEDVTNGTGNGKFSPDDSCTRGQIVTFLYRALAK